MALAARRRGDFLSVDQPLALTAPDHGVPRLTALTPAARQAGLRPGLALADARAALPTLLVRDAEPENDKKTLGALGLWCGRWSPRLAVDGADGIMLDITGCAHLFGGEAGLLSAVERAFARQSLTVRAAIAGRMSRAWAWARFGTAGILPAEGQEERLADLPVRALGLAPETVTALGRVGLRTIGQLVRLPRAALMIRFGADLATRLDRFWGEGEEPFAPMAEPARFQARLVWPEPIGRTEDIAAALRRLLQSVCRDLERAQEGARRVVLGLYRVDGEVARIEASTGWPVRDPAHLERLLALDLDGLDVGFGIEIMILEAVETAPLGARQTGLGDAADETALAQLVDQLAARLGPERVLRLEPAQSHVPERAVRLLPATALPSSGPWLAKEPRPLRVWQKPLPAEALARIPDGPPIRLAWRDGPAPVLHAEGPERILPEWWRPEDEGFCLRDFYRLTLADGRRLWVHREGAFGDTEPPVWRVQGVFH